MLLPENVASTPAPEVAGFPRELVGFATVCRASVSYAVGVGNRQTGGCVVVVTGGSALPQTLLLAGGRELRVRVSDVLKPAGAGAGEQEHGDR